MSIAEYQAATAGRQQTPDAPMTPDQQAKYDYALSLAGPDAGATSGGEKTKVSGATGTPTTTTQDPTSTYRAAFDSYLASLSGDGGKAAIYDEAAKSQADYAKQIAEVGQLGAGAIAGYKSTGTNVVGSGNAAIASQSASQRMSALSDAQGAALDGAEFQAKAIEDRLKSGTDIAKARLDFEKSLIPESKDTKPFIVGDKIYQLDPETGEYTSIGSKDKSITDQYGTGAIGEYNFAKANGYTGSFSQYQNEDANRKARASGSGSLSPTEQRLQEKLGQEDDIASAIIDFKTQMEQKNWKGANPEAYKYYREELTRLYGAAAALELDKAMKDAEIEVDRR